MVRRPAIRLLRTIRFRVPHDHPTTSAKRLLLYFGVWGGTPRSYLFKNTAPTRKTVDPVFCTSLTLYLLDSLTFKQAK